jgi:uncharacterized protein
VRKTIFYGNFAESKLTWHEIGSYIYCHNKNPNSMSKTVLITGGTGLVGSRLTELLIAKGYQVSYLSRRKENIENVKVYRWDIPKGYIEDGALETADYIVHLTGAGIADERWSDQRKQELIESRTKSIELIAKELQNRPFNIKACVSASGIGFYGADTDNEHLGEDAATGTDFIAHVTRSWENAVDLVANVGIRTVKLRTGIVLSEKGGALPKMSQTIRLNVGAPLGTGKQWISWIHIDDLCEMYISAIENDKWQGIYNAVAPNPVTNLDFTRQISEVLKKYLWLPNVPAFSLKLLLGEMAELILRGNYVLNNRIKTETDFQYQYPNIKLALNIILSESKI